MWGASIARSPSSLFRFLSIISPMPFFDGFFSRCFIFWLAFVSPIISAISADWCTIFFLVDYFRWVMIDLFRWARRITLKYFLLSLIFSIIFFDFFSKYFFLMIWCWCASIFSLLLIDFRWLFRLFRFSSWFSSSFRLRSFRRYWFSFTFSITRRHFLFGWFSAFILMWIISL